MSNARQVACDVVAAVMKKPKPLSAILDQKLRSAKLNQRDAALATEIAYGTIRYYGGLAAILNQLTNGRFRKNNYRLSAILLAGAYQQCFLDVPSYAVVDQAVEAAKAVGGPRVGGFVNAVLRKISAASWQALPESQRFHLPEWMRSALGEVLPAGEVPAAIEAFFSPAPLLLRANLRKMSAHELAAHLQNAGVDCEVSGALVRLRAAGSPARLPGYAEGYFSVQDRGAFRVGEIACDAANARGQAEVLDVCAGKGGKTLQLLERTDAIVDAADTSEAQLGLLSKSVERLGCAPRRIEVADARERPDRTYDVVLVDAPCTGLGVLRRHPEKHLHAKAADPATLANLQQQILHSAAAGVRPGGALIYAVCSFTRAEGEAVVDQFVETNQLFRLESAERTWPHRDDADGFYIAHFVRTA